ncbi:PadR family transcriptional regulator [Furfurilactobacillus siliginis]|uniref:PadR family transcriptional regulator n=1 Tax=Furfurilactobacillus siliginis TaxID=348151 RepID=A0A0R2LF39_9LACO|nr:PadR family transcriptional regulator [Furfurilactobacillus siliginis]KRN97271.1 hypothetical protein IV55_GL000199 [Furfurilactobacillus siliginis]GEK29670.1 PadR family transcriptional regulator [Furfurilactobacillus siliginis]
MMNELYVLGELMEGSKSGYGLRKSMELSLGRHRKISFGVVYPLLDKLAAANYIELADSDDAKRTKMATITEAGTKHFLELMQAPVPDGAHTEDIYQIKLDAMQHLTLPEQLSQLDLYIEEQAAAIADAKTQIADLQARVAKDHWYAAQKMQLRLQQAQVARDWAENFQTILTKGVDFKTYD